MQPWQDQLIEFDGKTWSLNQVFGGLLYHGSPHNIRDGTLLKGQPETNISESPTDKVALTSDVARAHYWAKKASKGAPYLIYTVEPLETIEIWCVGYANKGHNIVLWEGRVTAARTLTKIFQSATPRAQVVPLRPVQLRVWDELVRQPGRPPALSLRTVRELQFQIANDAEFWGDLLDRHGLREKQLAELDEATRQHAIGNFWCMLAQTAHEMGYKI